MENKPGVLARMSGLISRRGYNIESLAVGPTESPDMSRMTLQVNVDDVVLEQITKQLNKLIEVLKIVELEDSAVRRELVLVKVKATPETRGQLIEIIGLFGAKAVDLTGEVITVEATGSPAKLDALLELLRAVRDPRARPVRAGRARPRQPLADRPGAAYRSAEERPSGLAACPGRSAHRFH